MNSPTRECKTGCKFLGFQLWNSSRLINFRNWSSSSWRQARNEHNLFSVQTDANNKLVSKAHSSPSWWLSMCVLWMRMILPLPILEQNEETFPRVTKTKSWNFLTSLDLSPKVVSRTSCSFKILQATRMNVRSFEFGLLSEASKQGEKILMKICFIHPDVFV